MTTYKSLCGFLEDELGELDRRAKEKKLSDAEIMYGDKVAALAYHLKKLEKEGGDEGNSMWGYYDNGSRDNGSRENGSRESYRGRSYRGSRSYGRSMRDRGYSEKENEELKTLIEDMIGKTKDQHARQELENFLFKLEEME